MNVNNTNADEDKDKYEKPLQDDSDGIGRRIGRGLMRLLLVALVLFLLASSVVFVDETEYVIIERLGHITAVYDLPQDRGLHVKLPWPISSVRRFDRRVQLFDPPGREIHTSGKKNITIDTYVCWRIADPPQNSGDLGQGSSDRRSLLQRPAVRFFQTFGGIDAAESRLDYEVNSILAIRIGQVELSDLLSVEDSESGPANAGLGMLEGLSNQVHGDVAKWLGELQSGQEGLGIEVVDVRIKRINFPVGNQQSVFERMKSERKKIADRYRYDGIAKKVEIESQAKLQHGKIIAKANFEAERIRGEAEAEAISVLNRAHSRDPEFYRVVQTLDTYRKILNERTTLVLSASSSLLKLLTEGIPDLGEPPAPSGKSPNQTRKSPKAGKVSKTSRPASDSRSSDSSGDAPAPVAKDGATGSNASSEKNSSKNGKQPANTDGTPTDKPDQKGAP